MRGAFDGIRVLDFSHALAGPYCTMLMAQYGATVYKLESPGGGDIGRGWGPPFVDGEAAFFLALNSGKLGISIDLKHPQGRELCLRLADRCDVLVENFRPGTMEKLGLGWNAAHARNPRLVYCSISGYGQNGPSRDAPAMDLILQAASGLISMTGTEDGQLARCGHSVADITAGMFALIGIQMALANLERSGSGQYVDVSMLDGMISVMASNFGYYAGSGILPRPMGTAFATIVPYRTFPTADRDIAIAVASDKLWTAFCGAIGRPELEAHPDYSTNAARVEHRGVLEPLLMEIFRGAAAGDWLRRLGAAGVPCALVRNMTEVVEDPQTAVRGMFVEQDHPAAGAFRVTGPPVKLSATPGMAGRAAPLLGEHTRSALTEVLGLSQDELERMEREGLIAGH